MKLQQRHREYWRRTVGVTTLILLVWFFVTFIVAYYARDLNFDFFGWPFSFYMGAQGSLIVYCLLIGFYAFYMNRLDRTYGVDEEDDE